MTQHPGDPGWRRFFEDAAAHYDEEVFAQATPRELELLHGLLDLRSTTRVLDVGCGTGRHAVPLAQEGLEVTGVDLSRAMLAKAEARAARVGATLTLVEADVRRLPDHLIGFDVALCLCEGAFCLTADDAEPLPHDRAVLTAIHRALRPGGRLVLTALNAARLLAAWQRGDATGEIDLLTLTETTEHQLSDGSTMRLREHHHLPDGLRTLATSVGFQVDAVWAGGAGNWRMESPTVDDHELMLVARRPAAGS